MQNHTAAYFIRLTVFIVLYKLGEYLFNYLEGTTLCSSSFAAVYHTLSTVITWVAVHFCSVFHSGISLANEFIIKVNNVPTIRMMNGCTGFMQLFQIAFILILMPMKLKAKALFLPLGIAIIFFASVLHYIILIPAAYLAPGNFVIFHNLLSRILFYLFFFINFVLWNRYAWKTNLFTKDAE